VVALDDFDLYAIRTVDITVLDPTLRSVPLLATFTPSACIIATKATPSFTRKPM
jgi:hypothetical protein